MFKLQNGYEMPKLALGTYLLKNKELYNAVEKALEAGYRGFDTAKYYENEKDLGRALKALLPLHSLRTEDVFITTKIFPSSEEDCEAEITQEIERSLENLDRKYLDLVLIHYPRPLSAGNNDEHNKTYRKMTWLALEKLHVAGKIRSIGVSNYESNHIDEMSEYSKTLPQVNQVEFHPHFQRRGLRSYCQGKDILFQSFSPLGRGNKTLLNDETLVKIAHKHETTVAVIILAWIMQHKHGVVAKSATEVRIKENFRAASCVLTDDEMEKINGLDAETPYVEDRGWEVI